tara:strand:- start:21530 stop:22906 length:1377 start_codon:yes stop_codon:yes gene_type:complete
MSRSFSLKPKQVSKITTKHRKIVTDIPSPSTRDIISRLQKCEPDSMGLEVPVAWNSARDYQVFDNDGNCWIDFSSGIFVANVGHSHPKVCKAISKIVDQELLHNYYFPSKVRTELVEKLRDMIPNYLDKIFLLTTGSEATECAIKISRIFGRKKNPDKVGIISFEGAMHGKTLGALMAGGKTKEKHWIKNLDSDIHHFSFPDYTTCKYSEGKKHVCDEICFQKNIKELEKNVDLKTICAFIIESYQGWGALFYPKRYIDALNKWAKEKDALIIFDEIQAGFGRTGKLFAFEHYEIKPDLVCCGKGISSSLPLSAVLGRAELLNLDSSLNSTHGGNPICCAATLASLEVLEEEDLVKEANRKGSILETELKKIQTKYSDIIERISGKGLVYAIHLRDLKTKKLDIELGDLVIEKSMQKGVILVRTGSGTIKIGPPLTIPDDALLEGIKVIDDAIKESRK